MSLELEQVGRLRTFEPWVGRQERPNRQYGHPFLHLHTSTPPTYCLYASCTKAVILKVHSLRQLGNERLDFGNEHIEGDLSYVEFKIRSVILGDGGRKTKVGEAGNARSLLTGHMRMPSYKQRRTHHSIAKYRCRGTEVCARPCTAVLARGGGGHVPSGCVLFTKRHRPPTRYHQRSMNRVCYGVQQR